MSACTAVMSAEHFLIFTDFYTHVEVTCWHYQAAQWRTDATATVGALLELAATTRDGLSELNTTQVRIYIIVVCT